MGNYRGVDYLELERLLSDDEKLARDSARDFVEREIEPIIVEAFREETFPAHIIPKIGEMGFVGATFPEQYGGAGIGAVASGLIYQELERGDSGIRSYSSVQSCLVMFPIFKFGTEEQKQRWLPRIARGEKVGCFGLSEAGFGSNPAGMTSRAVKDGDSYILDGAKMWISFGALADVAVVWAKVKEEDKERIRGFLVEKGTPGFSVKEIRGKFSFRASVTSELVFEQCRIPAENLLPGTQGLLSPLACINEGRYGISWGAMGAASACYQIALDYAKDRVAFSRPIAGYQLVQRKLVWMLSEITKGQLLCYHLGRLKEEGKLRPEQGSLAKMNNASMALKVARTARDILGANGIIDEFHVIRHLLNLETVNTYEGTEDINRLIVGKDITGLAAFE
jgi:glutaryl-CoA dehydrogenase